MTSAVDHRCNGIYDNRWVCALWDYFHDTNEKKKSRLNYSQWLGSTMFVRTHMLELFGEKRAAIQHDKLAAREKRDNPRTWNAIQ